MIAINKVAELLFLWQEILNTRRVLDLSILDMLKIFDVACQDFNQHADYKLISADGSDVVHKSFVILIRLLESRDPCLRVEVSDLLLGNSIYSVFKNESE